MGEEGEKKQEENKRVHTYALVRSSDMNEEMRTEATELCVTACEKFATNFEQASRMIKESMDKKFGPAWHAVVGRGYGYEVTHESRNKLYMFFAGDTGILLWKCA